MRYNEVINYLLQNFMIEEVKPYDMVKALGGNISKYTYRRDNNGKFSKNEVNSLIAYFKNKEFIPNLNQNSTTDNIIQFPVDRVEIGYWSELPEELKNPKISSVWFDREIIENDWKMSAEHLCIIPMIGDKMTHYWYPIRSGDILIVDLNQNKIMGNGVYFGTSRNNTRFWIREMQMLINNDLEVKGYAPSGNTTKVLTNEIIQEVDFKLIGKVVKNVSFRL